MLSACDALVLAAPLTPDTNGMIDEDALRAMPNNSVLVNVARGALVDSDALLATLRDGHLAAAILDVFDQEPLPPDDPLTHTIEGLPNGYQLGGITVHARNIVGEGAGRTAGDAVTFNVPDAPEAVGLHDVTDTTVTVDWGDTEALGNRVSDAVLSTSHTLTLQPMTECGRFFFRVRSSSASSLKPGARSEEHV